MKMIFLIGLMYTQLAMANQSYQQQLGIEINADKAAFIFDIPESVYQHVYYKNLSDVRIINASGDFVPMRIVQNNNITQYKYTQTSLPTFKLNKITTVPINTKQKRITSSGSLQDYTIETSRSMRHFIESHESIDDTVLYIDASSLKEQKIEKLSLDWKFQNQGNRLFYLTLSGSNDLSHWKIINSRQKLLEIKSGHKTILENTLVLNKNQYLYYQLKFKNNIVPEIKNVLAHLVNGFVDENHLWKDIESLELHHDNSIQFDSGGYYPIDAFEFEFNQKNILTDISVYSRNSTKGQWKLAGSGNLYSILVDGELNEKNTIKFRRSNNRHWKIVMEKHINNTSVKSIQFSWKNHQLAFLAQGKGPYALQFGNKAETRHASNNWFNQLPASIEFSNEISISDKVMLKKQEPRIQKTEIKSDNAKITFWVVLGIVILLLAFMAYKLVNENQDDI